MKNQLRIIGGDWKRRQLPFASIEGLRPTTDRTVSQKVSQRLVCKTRILGTAFLS
jgi:16S rRNA G966 N2-methylase RsmD